MASDLGDFLRARRAQVTPAQLGLPSYGARRVAGLRREEVARQAEMSVDYYTRLEQGRERHPSPQVLDALGQALQLSEDSRSHLYRLAGLSPRPDWVPLPERVDPALLALLDRWPDTPALVLGRAYDVLAANRLGEALFGASLSSRNLVVALFCDPAARQLYADWPLVAANTVAGLRLAQGAWGEAPRVRAVVDRLLQDSPEFARLWQRNDARGKTLEVKRFRHPEVGPLTLGMQSFDVRAAPGQQLVVYSAESGSASAEGLALLGSVAATAAG
ncbi:helix-turn-helix transcriptional regulator [Modestobacter sp. VKM Ac-2986]|uniref:helix-turn-helix transcriptional regulator n=1 Tax=Modestobacter sp. VKM Ac-2986 TaxID=3004140 RepID=UPI0022AB4B09|nr:helix-turn-helix transcriptional regulator [Modestobacter sp. VKM Ac-2986]MCZ2828519.1 helix-turn-helix transcriptional regulator [Modestobacter sp. VKM Ac-2986]